jgi:hypothetical protein
VLLSLLLLPIHFQVTREERRLARDKAAYQRIKQAYVASGGAAAGRKAAAATAAAGPGLGSGGWQLSTVDVVGGATAGSLARRSSNVAGAVAAAARELRPVELVELYEAQKEALEKELAAAKAEVRGLRSWHFAAVTRLGVCRLEVQDRSGLQVTVCRLFVDTRVR